MGALRNQFPSAQIDYLVREPYKELFTEDRTVDSIIPVDLSGMLNIFRTIRSLRKTQYDLTLVVWPASRNAILGLLTGAKMTVGYLTAYSDKAFYLDHHRVSSIGCPIAVIHEWSPELPFSMIPGRVIESIGGSLSYFRKNLEMETSSSDMILFHLFSRMQNRSLSVTTAEELIRSVAVAYPSYALKVIGWPQYDANRMRSIHNDHPAVQFIAGGDLMDELAIIQKTKLVVCIDSGVMHLSEMLDKPIVAIFGPTHPLLSISKKTVYSEQVSLFCSHLEQRICGNKECPLSQHCLDRINITTIQNAIKEWIENGSLNNHNF